MGSLLITHFSLYRATILKTKSMFFVFISELQKKCVSLQAETIKTMKNMEVKTIGLASDHAGYALKQFVKKYLDEKGYEYKDYGTYTEDSCDYSDFGHALAEGIEKGEVFPGIAICGSGEGINMTLNKHQSIRAGLCWIPEIAHLIRQHNNANVLVMPGRFISEDTARQIMDEYFTTEFEGGRHQKRIDKIPVK